MKYLKSMMSVYTIVGLAISPIFAHWMEYFITAVWNFDLWKHADLAAKITFTCDVCSVITRSASVYFVAGCASLCHLHMNDLALVNIKPSLAFITEFRIVCGVLRLLWSLIDAVQRCALTCHGCRRLDSLHDLNARSDQLGALSF